jgi:peptidoglycan/LPS O-acetylase OafA/YrhL
MKILQDRLNQPSIPALDGVRAVAVFLVILYHFGFSRVPGGHGVMLFFVLSGFLITWLLLKENDKTGTISLKGFYWRRVLRIFPAFYVFWFLMVAYLLARGKDVPWAHAWSSFFYLSNYYAALNHHPENLFSHTWSLAIEEQFYLLWPAAFIFLRRDLRRLTGFLVALIALVWVYRAVLVYGFGVNISYIYSAFDTRLDHLMVGCLLAVLLKREALPRVWSAVTTNAAAPLVTIALLAASVYAGQESLAPRYRDVFGYAVEPLLMAVFIVQMVKLSASGAWSWTEWGWVKYLGRISYPLYLYQQFTIYPTSKALAFLPWPLQLAGVIAATVIAASLSYFLVERYFLKLKDAGRKHEQRPLASQPAPGEADTRTEVARVVTIA